MRCKICHHEGMKLIPHRQIVLCTWCGNLESYVNINGVFYEINSWLENVIKENIPKEWRTY